MRVHAIALVAAVLPLAGCEVVQGPMDRFFGYPTKEERAPMAERQARLKAASKPTLTIYPVSKSGALVGGRDEALELAEALNQAGGVQATVPSNGVRLRIKRGVNEGRQLWDLARAFREHVQAQPPQTDYALYVEYFVNEQTGQVGAVHQVLVDRSGEWVVVDFQNSHSADFQQVNPHSVADCGRLAVKRLGNFLPPTRG